jgi:hypothetical protein
VERKVETHLGHDLFGLELADRFNVVVEPRRLLVVRESVGVLRLLLVLRTSQLQTTQHCSSSEKAEKG